MISMTGSDPVGNGLIPLTPANQNLLIKKKLIFSKISDIIILESRKEISNEPIT